MAPRRQIGGNRGQGVTPGRETAVRTVTVACKLPNGLLLQLFEWKNESIQTPMGVRSEKTSVRLPQTYKINGNAYAIGGRMPKYEITKDLGFALTPGIPEDFWDKWYEQNKEADYVRNGFIFAHRHKDDVLAQAHEYEDVRSGLEPLDPENLPKEFRPKKRKDGTLVGGIATKDDE